MILRATCGCLLSAPAARGPARVSCGTRQAARAARFALMRPRGAAVPPSHWRRLGLAPAARAASWGGCMRAAASLRARRSGAPAGPVPHVRLFSAAAHPPSLLPLRRSCSPSSSSFLLAFLLALHLVRAATARSPGAPHLFPSRSPSGRSMELEPIGNKLRHWLPASRPSWWISQKISLAKLLVGIHWRSQRSGSHVALNGWP